MRPDLTRLNECLADRGNQSIATCVLGITGCLPDSPDAQRCFLADTDCVLATKKINACMEAIGSTMPPARFTGWCNDRARLATLAGMKTVAFRSWSVTYLACTIDPKTCRCPGQPWYTEL